MNDDDFDIDLERHLREGLRSKLPVAPTHLVTRVDRLPVEHPDALHRRPPSKRFLMAAVLGLSITSLIGALVLADRNPDRSAAAAASSPASPRASVTSTIDGVTVHSVSELVALRQNGKIAGEPVGLSGYWSARLRGRTCGPPPEKVGDLELRCDIGQWGITENDEAILTTGHSGQKVPAEGPYLQPFLSDEQFKTLMSLPTTNGQPYPPVPIVVIGHFDDPRAADCGPKSVQVCRDRLVLDQIIEFNPSGVPTAGITPPPTPFPFDKPPAAMFDAAQCAGEVSYSFIGWKALGELLPGRGDPGEVVFGMVTSDVVPLGDSYLDPAGSGQQVQPIGRLICYAPQWDHSGVTFGWVPGTAYLKRADGNKTSINP